MGRILHSAGLAVLLAGFGAAVIAATELQTGNVGCTANLKQLSTGLQMYSLDYDGKLPLMKTQKSFSEGVKPYVPPRELFVCPDTKQAYLPNAALASKLFKQLPNQGSTILVSDSKPHTGGMYNVLYADGHMAQLKTLPGSKPAKHR